MKERRNERTKETKKKRSKIDLSKEADGFSSGLGGLSGLSALSQLSPMSDQSAEDSIDSAPVSLESAEDVNPVDPLLQASKLTLRWTKKGRGGKSVTLIQGADIHGKRDRKLCTLIGESLGCRASIEDAYIAVQGDQRERLKTWLVSKGVKVTKIRTA